MWGGTSIKNVDCSGLTRSVFFANGILLPRNASQQARCGEEVPFVDVVWNVSKGDAGDGSKGAAGDAAVSWSRMLPGDLIFWGREATESTTEKVSHVGIYIGGGNFIHSSHYVRIGSLDPSSEYFYDRKPLHVRRIVGSSGLCGQGTASVFSSPSYFAQD
jgi:cell wall-associated NlpC family hydrolase